MTGPASFAIDEDESLASIVSRLAGDTRALAQAEIAVQKAKVGDRIAAYKSAVAFFAVAGVLALAALIALLVGLIMTLATNVGPGWATLIVVGTVLVIAAILGFVGKSRLAPSA